MALNQVKCGKPIGDWELDVETRQVSEDLAVRAKARRTGGTTLGTQGNGVRQGPTRS